jgi:hypothetical protein
VSGGWLLGADQTDNIILANFILSILENLSKGKFLEKIAEGERGQ